MEPTDTELISELEQRFKELPPAVQRAIISADVATRMRELAKTHNLHIDQWALLENEVRMALFGIQPVDQLPENLRTSLRVSSEESASLAADISKIVFEPIRQELERQLEHPNAEAAITTGVEDMRAREIAGHQEHAKAAAEDARSTPSPAAPLAPAAQAAPKVMPATPPIPAPTEKMTRAPMPESYHGSASHERKTIEGDPYREQLSP